MDELKTKRIKNAIVDAYVVEYLKPQMIKNKFKIKAADIGDPAEFGIEAFHELGKLEKCAVAYVQEHAEMVNEAVNELKNRVSKIVESGKSVRFIEIFL